MDLARGHSAAASRWGLVLLAAAALAACHPAIAHEAHRAAPEAAPDGHEAPAGERDAAVNGDENDRERAGPRRSRGGGHVPPVAPEEGPVGVFDRLIYWLGKFHPPVISFPVGLLVAAAVAEALWLLTARPLFDAASRYCIWFGALGAVTAAILGWFYAGLHWTDPSWILTTHRWLGTSTALWAALVLTLGETARRRGSRALRAVFAVTLFAAAALVLVTGFFGGAMIYGIDHYAWPEEMAPGLQPAREAEKPPAKEAAVTVGMTNDLKYDPEKVTIRAGQTVRWENTSDIVHTVTADAELANDPAHVRLPEGAEPFNSGNIPPGGTYTHTFTVPGSYRYFCIPHEAAGMIGQVEVKPAEEAEEAAAEAMPKEKKPEAEVPAEKPAAEAPAEKRKEKPQAEEVAVTVGMTNDLKYDPEKVTILAGQTVRWENTSDIVHTVTADAELANDPAHVHLPDGAEPFNSGDIPPGGTYAHTFTVPGSYRYFCIPHEAAGMIGQVEVKPADSR